MALEINKSILSFVTFYCALLFNYTALHSTCADVAVTATVTALNFQTNFVQLPPQFTNITVVNNTNVGELCTASLNVTDSTSVSDTVIPGQYDTLHNWDILRANRSLFPTFGNELILTATDAANFQYFGISMALSADGSTLAVGAVDTEGQSFTGSVYMYRRKGTSWIFKQGFSFSDPINSTFFGVSLALSYDGSILVIGSPINEFVLGVPYVFLYLYNASLDTWELFQTLTDAPLSGLGTALDISATGQYLAVSQDPGPVSPQAAQPTIYIPTVQVYSRQNTCAQGENAWSDQTQLVPRDNAGNFIFTAAVHGDDSRIIHLKHIAISADGTTLAMGIPFATNSNFTSLGGAVALFKRTGSSWQQTQLIPSPITDINQYFGASVALSADGEYCAVGAPSYTVRAITPYVYVFAKRGGIYQQEAVFAGTAGTFLGSSVALSADGTVLTFGSAYWQGSGTGQTPGSLTVALRAPNNMWRIVNTFSPLTGSDVLGHSCACSADGAFIAAGAPAYNTQTGYTAIFSPIGSFIPNDTVVSGSLCVYHKTTIDSTLNVAGNIHVQNTIVTGTAGHVTACVAPLASSDQRLKDVIEPLSPERALEIIRALKPVEFDWKGEPDPFDTIFKSASQFENHSPLCQGFGGHAGRAGSGCSGKKHTGFLAQELEQIAPHWVKVQTTPEGEVKMIYLHQELYAYIIKALEALAENTQKNRVTLEKLKQRNVREPW